jgi:Carbohydrate esterase, sialic acid-specific acetylesterase
MPRILYTAVSMFLFFTAVGLALGAVFPASPMMAGVYLTVALLSFVLIVVSYCAKCPHCGSQCVHVLPGKIAAVLTKPKSGAHSFADILLIIIGINAVILIPQLWLVYDLRLLVLFWVFIVAAGFVVVCLICPGCPVTLKTSACVKKAAEHVASACKKTGLAIRHAMRNKIAMSVLSLGIIVLGCISLGVLIIRPVGLYPDGMTVVYFRFGLNVPLVSYVFFEESESKGLDTQGLAVTKPIFDRKIFSLPYSPGLYVLSTGGAEQPKTGGNTSANRPSNSMTFNPNFQIYRKSRDSVITYFFLGHSNMSGYCAKMDVETNANVWLYADNKGFYHGTDHDLSNNSGSPIMPFLKRMAVLYPEYHFCGVKDARPGMTIEDYLANKNDTYTINKMKILKKKSIIGGVLLMFGFDEGSDLKKVQALDVHLKRLIDELREASGNRTLPFIFGRYEENGSNGEYADFHRWNGILINKIDSLEKIDGYLKLTPIRPISRQCFCDDHHYNAEGYRIWAEDAAAIIQLNRFDFWKGK